MRLPKPMPMPLLDALKHRALPGLRVGGFRPLPSHALGLLSAAMAGIALFSASSRPWTVPFAGLLLVAAALARAWPPGPRSPLTWRAPAAPPAAPPPAPAHHLLGVRSGV